MTCELVFVYVRREDKLLSCDGGWFRQISGKRNVSVEGDREKGQL